MKYVVMIGLLITSSAAMAQVTPQMVQDSAAALIRMGEAQQEAERLAEAQSFDASIPGERFVDEGWQKMMDSAEEVDGAEQADNLASWGKWDEQTPEKPAGDGVYYVIDKAAATYTVPEDDMADEDVDWLDLKK